ncbi:MAG: TrmH family RNA methyltransferase [bacterium]
MDRFPFTKKKLLSLPRARQHKWIANWLREIYIALISQKISDTSLKQVYLNLAQVRSWIDLPGQASETPDNRKKWMEYISNAFHEHQQETGIGLAEHALLPRVLTGDKSNDHSWIPQIPYRVALENLRSAFNVGSIIRLIDATGFESALLTSKTPGLENRQVTKTAMGAADWIPLQKTDQMPTELLNLKADGYRIIGIETVADCASYMTYPWPQQGVVVLGNEEYGISESVLQACDDYVHIPMAGRKNSINVANAFAVIAFHIRSLKSNSISSFQANHP